MPGKIAVPKRRQGSGRIRENPEGLPNELGAEPESGRKHRTQTRQRPTEPATQSPQQSSPRFPARSATCVAEKEPPFVRAQGSLFRTRIAMVAKRKRGERPSALFAFPAIPGIVADIEMLLRQRVIRENRGLGKPSIGMSCRVKAKRTVEKPRKQHVLAIRGIDKRTHTDIIRLQSSERTVILIPHPLPDHRSPAIAIVDKVDDHPAGIVRYVGIDKHAISSYNTHP